MLKTKLNRKRDLETLINLPDINPFQVEILFNHYKQEKIKFPSWTLKLDKEY